jgi:RHS repeat-associated protein
VSYFSYAANGDRELEFHAPPGDLWVTLRRLYYDGLGRTVGLRDVGITDGNGPGRYRCNLYGPSPYVLAPCSGGVEVPVWLVYDGPNVGATMQTNRWVFLHGGGIDDPLMAYYRGSGTPTEYYWITDGAGRHLAAGTSDGSLTSDSQQGQHYLYRGGKWVGSTSAATSYEADRQSTITAPGYTFFRNRVYDQRTARWTQEDPIGIAGGLNLYQFNGANPTIYSDPFGLAPTGPCVGTKAFRLACIAMTFVKEIVGAGPGRTEAERRLDPFRVTEDGSISTKSMGEGNSSEEIIEKLDEGSKQSSRGRTATPAAGGSKVDPRTQRKGPLSLLFVRPGQFLRSLAPLLVCAPCMEYQMQRAERATSAPGT